MLKLIGNDNTEILLDMNLKENLGISSSENDFDFEIAEEEEGEGDKIVKVDFAGSEDLKIISEVLENLDTIEKVAQDVINTGIEHFLKILEVSNYLQFEKFSEILKSKFFEKINLVATEGEQIADYFRIIERVDNLKNFLKIEEEEFTSEEKKEIVKDSRYLNGQTFPQVLKFEEFYCEQKVDSKLIHTEDIRKDLDYDN